MNILTDKIKWWATERDLNNGDPDRQVLKLGEEYGELCDYMTKDKDISLAEDAIGDIYIVLTILCMQLDLDIKDCVELAYQEIMNRKGKMINGSFVKEGDF